MARTETDLGTYDGVNVQMMVEDDSIAAGSGTVPGTITFRNDNEHPVTELEGQVNSKLNILPSSLSFKKINPGINKTIHFLVNVTESSKPGSYDINVDFDFKIDTPPSTTRALTIDVTKAAE